MFYFSDNEIDQFISEDLPYFDITTSLCELDGFVELSFITRESGIVSGVEEAEKIFKKLECNSKVIKKSGDSIAQGDVIFVAKGYVSNIMSGWKVAQNMIEYASGVASLAKNVVQIAKSINPNIEVVATRKTMPGAKKLLTKAIVAGGASPHRLGLSETILFFEQHIELMGGWDMFCEKFQEIKHKAKEKKIIVEVTDLNGSLGATKIGADIIQMDKIKPSEATSIIEQVREINPNVMISLAGGINLQNAQEYAKTGADILVTSALYHAKPLDITTKVVKAEYDM